MIKTFKHKGLENLYLNGIKKGVQAKHVKRLLDILDLLNAADNIQVMNFPGSKLHKLNPKSKDIWAVSISGNWRVSFKFIDGDAYLIDYLDYH